MMMLNGFSTFLLSLAFWLVACSNLTDPPGVPLIPKCSDNRLSRLSQEETQASLVICTRGLQFLPGDTVELGSGMSSTPLSTTLISTGPLRFRFSPDSGQNWTDTLNNISDAQTESVRIQLPQTLSKHCLLKSLEQPSLKSLEFSLQELVLVSPLGGDTVFVGDTLKIEWRSRHEFPTGVVIGFSKSPEDKQDVIAPGSVQNSDPNWPSFNWEIPEGTSCENCQIYVADYEENSPFTINRFPFVIKAK